MPANIGFSLQREPITEFNHYSILRISVSNFSDTVENRRVVFTGITADVVSPYKIES